jgi:hypothetical protein
MSVMHTSRARSRKGLTLFAGAGVLALGALAGVGAVSAAAATPQALPSGCSGSSPIACHYDVSPGNYDVTVSIGSSTAAGSTAMWVEARRLMLPTTQTAVGKVTTYSFTINVRQPGGAADRRGRHRDARPRHAVHRIRAAGLGRHGHAGEQPAGRVPGRGLDRV